VSIGTAAIIAQSESLRHFSPQGSGSGKAGAFFLRPQSPTQGSRNVRPGPSYSVWARPLARSPVAIGDQL